MRLLKISWQSANLSDQNANVGHGLCVYADSMHNREHLAAFVEGFAWCREANMTFVLYDPELLPWDKQEFAAFKAALEARIHAGDISPSEFIPGYWCIANA